MKVERINEYKNGAVWPLIAADLKPGFTPVELLDAILRVSSLYENLTTSLKKQPADIMKAPGEVAIRVMANEEGDLCIGTPDPGEKVPPSKFPDALTNFEIVDGGTINLGGTARDRHRDRRNRR